MYFHSNTKQIIFNYLLVSIKHFGTPKLFFSECDGILAMGLLFCGFVDLLNFAVKTDFDSGIFV